MWYPCLLCSLPLGNWPPQEQNAGLHRPQVRLLFSSCAVISFAHINLLMFLPPDSIPLLSDSNPPFWMNLLLALLCLWETTLFQIICCNNSLLPRGQVQSNTVLWQIYFFYSGPSGCMIYIHSERLCCNLQNINGFSSEILWCIPVANYIFNTISSVFSFSESSLNIWHFSLHIW